MEDCRIVKQNFARSIAREEYAIYKNGVFNFAWFNKSGSLEYWVYQPYWIVFEIPCYGVKWGAYDRIDYTPWNVTLKTCESLDLILHRALKSQGQTFGTFDAGNIRFCFEEVWIPSYPFLEEPPIEYKDFRIHPKYFYIKHVNGSVNFKSPNIADFKRLAGVKSYYIDDGLPLHDYMYDYW